MMYLLRCEADGGPGQMRDGAKCTLADGVVPRLDESEKRRIPVILAYTTWTPSRSLRYLSTLNVGASLGVGRLNAKPLEPLHPHVSSSLLLAFYSLQVVAGLKHTTSLQSLLECTGDARVRGYDA